MTISSTMNENRTAGTGAFNQQAASFPDEDRGCAARGTLVALAMVIPFWLVVAFFF